MKNSVAVRIFGDICSDRMYKAPFIEGNSNEIFGFTRNLIADASVSIVNLECPLTDKEDPIRKSGPCLIGPLETASVLAEAGFDVVGLANNHIMDQNVSGLRTTIRVCKQAGLKTVGAGENLQEARQPLIINEEGIRLGIYCMAESEFSIASENRPGANDIQAVNWIKDLTHLKANSDYIIVLLHSGREHYPLPTPRQQKLCRDITGFGANLVICQHSHCIGATERYNDSHIVYGQGNYIFGDSGKEPESWFSGAIVEVNIEVNKTASLRQIYYKQSHNTPHITSLNPQELLTIGRMQRDLDEKVLHPDIIKEEWNKLSSEMAPHMLYTLGGYQGFLLRVLRKLKMHKYLYKSYTRLAVGNLLRCQTHRELLEDYFENN